MAGLPFENLPVVQENIDVFNLLDQRFSENLLALDQSYEAELGRLDKPLTQQKRSLQRQYDIKVDYLGKQFLTDEDHAKQLSNLNRQLELGASKAEDRQTTIREELSTTYQQNKLQLQQQYNQQKIRIQQIRDLVNQGHLSPEVGTQQQLRILGISVPLTQMKSITPIDQFKELESIEDRIEEELARHWIPPTTGGFWGRAKPLMYSPTGQISVTAAGITIPEEATEATEEQKFRYEDLLNQLNAVRAAKLEVLGQYEPRRAVLQRRARKLTDLAIRETTSFKGEIEKSKQEYLRKVGRVAVTGVPSPDLLTKQPTPEELRRQNTREAYEQGRKLGYWK